VTCPVCEYEKNSLFKLPDSIFLYEVHQEEWNNSKERREFLDSNPLTVGDEFWNTCFEAWLQNRYAKDRKERVEFT
jgi:hypothetical protein